MESDPHVLAVDLGTSGPKVALVSSEGAVVGGEFEPIELILLPGGGAEQDPEQWWRAIVTASRRAIANAGVPPGSITAVSVTAQWSGTVAIDATGRHIGNAIIWMDSRGQPFVADLVGGPVRVRGYDPRKLRTWIRLTGGAPSGSGKDPIAHILYLRHQHPDVYQQAAVFLEPKDYLNLRLTGETVASFDSIALHWLTDNRDPNAVDYHEDLLELAAIERDRLPRLTPATEIIGTVTAQAASELGLERDVVVIGGTPDVHSAAIGAGTTADLAAHLYIGTSSWITCHVPFKKTDLIHNIATLPAPVPGRYLIANEQETAGKALEWAARLLFPPPIDAEVYAEMERMASRVAPGAGGVIFTPWLYGERTPVEDATLRGGFFNQSLETGRAELIRAVFEGVALNARWLLQHVEKLAGTRLDPIAAAGGGARSQLWAQIHADILGRTIRLAEDPVMANVRGAGLLAHAAIGTVAWNDIPHLVPVSSIHVPDPANTQRYERTYDAFRRIHRATRRITRDLNRP